MDALLGNAYLALAAMAFLAVAFWALIAFLFLRFGGARQPFLLGPVFAVVHAVAVAVIAITTPANMTATPLAGMGWLLLCIANYPSTLLFPRAGAAVPLLGFFVVFGTLHHLLVGTVVAAVYVRLRRKEPHAT